ncbi:MAG: sulfotransferase family protein, partial [Acidimicrobiales bacterium]
ECGPVETGGPVGDDVEAVARGGPSGARVLLPTFLGIGVPKAATTWLHGLLSSHPDVLMAQGPKAVHFFDLHFDKGVEWYAEFFPARPGAPPLAVGDFTPHYLYEPACPARIKATVPADRFLLILRNPVARLESHYRFRQRQDGYTGSFDDFQRDYPKAVDWCRYAHHLRPWLDHFEPSQFCVLLQEEAGRDIEATKQTLAGFLGVDADRFPPDAGQHVANDSFVPKRRRLYAVAVAQARFLRARGLGRVVAAGKKSGLARRVSSRRSAAGPRLDADTRERLWEWFADDVAELERTLGRSLDRWRSG